MRSARRFLIILCSVVGLCGCRAVHQNDTLVEPVRAVEFKGTPEIKELAERARQIGNESYPKVLKVLGENPSEAPRQFTVVFQNHASVKTLMNDDSGGYTKGGKIYLGLDWLTNTPEVLDGYLVHEMTHIAQNYNWRTTSAPAYWTEGIADYVRYRLGYTNWQCAKCSAQCPHYTSGYMCAAAFLLFLDSQYTNDLVPKLNRTLHHNSYSDKFFERATGKPLKQLWADFQETPAFTPTAGDMLKFEESFGYVNGQPPKNVAPETLKKVARERALASIKESSSGPLIAEALQFLTHLKDADQLPGWKNGEIGRINVAFKTLKTANASNFPFQYTFKTAKAHDSGTYFYTVSRESESSAWKLEKAWYADNDGHLVKDL